MKCTTCGLDGLKILDTRDKGLFVVRRRKCEEGHVWETYELSGAAIGAIGRHRIETVHETLERGIVRRQGIQSRREIVLHFSGLPTAEVAKLAECSEQRVRQIRQSVADG